MALVTLNELLPVAREQGRAVGAFNIANYETAKAVIMAAEAEDSPVIIQIYQRLMDDPHIAALGVMMRKFAEDASVDVAVHLDHGASYEQVVKAIDCGFSSVMYDGSQLPFEENLAQTKKAAEYAHQHGVSIEGEIGHVPLNSTLGDAMIPLSTPEEAARFANETGVDALAVSIGTAHGYYSKTPVIDVALAGKIKAAVSVPLVLHGGSGTPHDTVKAVIKNGFAKVNVATEFQHAFETSVYEEMGKLNGKFVPLDKLMIVPTEVAVKHLCQLIKLFS